MITARAWPIALMLALGVAVTATAQDQPPHRAPDAAKEQHGGGVLRLLPSDAVTQHTMEIAAGKLSYTATAGTMSLYDQSGERTAEIFYTAYVAKGDDAATRPVTFVFNGGPGAASAFLHLGLVGPKILQFGSSGRDGAAAALQDNPETWLRFTDLVMIDPVGTGWSRAEKPDNAHSFWEVQRDAESIAKTIALYVANNSRTASPKYLLGESYGGFRSIRVAQALQKDQGLIISGILMVSPLLDSAFQFGADRFALGAALQLPSLIATELERKNAFSDDRLAEGERFALNEYLTTLAGPELQREKAQAFYARVAALTGMPVDVVAKSRGFIRNAYVKHLRSTEHQVVSRYDATLAVDDPFLEADAPRGPDPILDGFVRALGGAFVGYARDQLGFNCDITYILLNGEISGKWEWRHGNDRAPPSVTDDLRELLALDPSFRVLIAAGYSDLVIPYATHRYVINHLPKIGAPDRVQLRLYRGGHMFYFDDASRHALTADARAFYQQGSQAGTR